ncbi:hypothetical protein JTE90_010169 [Oedothorax gibbosus]|uniref:TFIIS N-terminal domain-containing protein n=1 Tax=Oedothorax gibbosus TaxID=931172 RepID=A0AAV6UAE2_9ARAC|nr:hypothetical protein JTE90_010169 [Oedothorax gibbosus]
MATTSIKEYILYYKNKLDRYKDDEDMVIETIQKLGKPSVNAELVQETGILRHLHKLCKEKGKVAEIARALFNKWKHVPSVRDKKSPEEQANSLVKAPPRDVDPPVWGNHVGAGREPPIHPAHRSNNQEIPLHERGSTKRKDHFPSEAEHKRLSTTHLSHREAKHTAPQKDYQANEVRPHRSTNHHDSNLDRSKHSATKKEFLSPDGDLSMHSTTRRHLFPPDDVFKHSTAQKAVHPHDGILDGYSSKHPPIHRDSIGPDGHSSSIKDGYSRHPSTHRDSFGPDGQASSATDGHSRHPPTHRHPPAHASSATDGYSRHPPTHRDSFGPDGLASSAIDGYSSSATDGYSRHPTSRKDHFVQDGESSRHGMTQDDPFSLDVDSSRHSTFNRDHFASDVDSSRHSFTRKEHNVADDEHSRHHMTRKDHIGEGEYSRQSTRKHHFHDVDSTKHPLAKKDHFTSEDHSSHHNKDLVRSETTSHRGEFKARKELFTSDNNSRHSSSSRYSCGQRDPISSETESVVNRIDIDDDWRNMKKLAKNDYFVPDADGTELNGTLSSQELNHHIDIDSLSNPNLNIDTGHLNTSDDSENASPTKRARAREPYSIEMREGMFRAIKDPKGPAVNEEGLRFYELIHRTIVIGHKSKDQCEKVERKDKNNSTLTMSPRDASNDCEKWNAKNGPSDPKMAAEKSVRAKPNPKRKSDSPCKGKEKRVCADSGPDPKLKIKKETLSPSHLPKAANHIEGHQSNCDRNKIGKIQDSPETSAMQYMSSSKKDRRSVYSGRKTVQDISSLKNLCLQVLRKNLDYLQCSKKVPYQSLQPLLETLNPSQLSKVEEHNRFLSAYTNSLWKQHYHRDHRSQVVVKKESDIVWKDEYNRAQEIKRKKLKNITAGINAAASKAKPDRQAKVIETQVDFGRRGARNVEIPVSSSKSSVPTQSPVVVGSRSSSSPTSKAASSNPKTLPPVNSKPKETKHLVAHKPVKKAVAPLMSKVKKSMAIVYSRQK